MDSVYFCGRILTGACGEVKRNQYVSVENGKIVSVSSQRPPECTDIVNWSDYTVMPGLINCHTHVGIVPAADSNLVLTYPLAQRVILIQKHLVQLLASGVTTIRDLGCYDDMDIQIRDCIRNEFIIGPDMFVSGPMLTMTGGHSYTVGVEVDGKDTCRKAARQRLKSGADLVKVMATGGVLTKGVEPGNAQLSCEEMTVICEEAHKAGKKVAAHAQGTTGIQNALNAGVDSIEHGFFMNQKIIDQMVRKGVYYVPTFCAPYFMACKGKELGLAQEFIDKVYNSLEAHASSFTCALNSGVKIACGTDAGTPFNGHDMTAKEIVLLCEHGMSNAQAIQAATQNAAECIGVADRGKIESGLLADMIAVEGNPLEDIHCLETSVRYVVKRGRLFDTDVLKRSLLG